jgi:hypothetical protein
MRYLHELALTNDVTQGPEVDEYYRYTYACRHPSMTYSAWHRWYVVHCVHRFITVLYLHSLSLSLSLCLSLFFSCVDLSRHFQLYYSHGQKHHDDANSLPIDEVWKPRKTHFTFTSASLGARHPGTVSGCA